MEESNGNMSTVIIGVIVLLVVIVAGGAFFLLQNDSKENNNDATDGVSTSADRNTSNDTTTTPSETKDQSDDTPGTSGETVEYTIEMDNYKFFPDQITAAPGDTVKIILVSKSHEHDFVIDELDVESKLLGNNETQTIEFEIPEDAAGKSYEYYCSVGIHRQLGMVGKLTIQ